MPDRVPIPPLFLERMYRLLGDEYQAFAAALQEQPVSGLRVNTLKLAPKQFKAISPFALGTPVPWCDSAFTLTPAPLPWGEGFTRTPASQPGGEGFTRTPASQPGGEGFTLTPATLPMGEGFTRTPASQPGGEGFTRTPASQPGGEGFTRTPASQPVGEGFTRTPAALPAGEGFGKHPYHMAGLYYLQDPSAMAPAELLGPRPGERVLDLAAAPGGKTTALAALMQGGGLLVANEIKDKRVGHLAVNVERWGAGNVVITNETPERLADHFGPFFDRVLVDAPCSGEGMFRKDRSARLDWSLEMVAGCAVRQRAILRVAARLVKPGGYLVYSTCTFAPEEDEGIISNFLTEFPEYEVLSLPGFPGFMPGRPEWLASGAQGQGLEGAVRLFPHRISGEGHFACLLKRAGSAHGEADWGPDRLASPSRAQERLWLAFAGEVLKVDLAADRLRVRGERLYLIPEQMPDFGNPSTGRGRGLRVLHPGVWLGTFKKERFEPAHPLALFLKPGQARNVLDLPAEEMGERRSPLRAYLGGESLPAEGAPGWTLVSVDGWPLGWGKRVQNILKNHYPKGWHVYS